MQEIYNLTLEQLVFELEAIGQKKFRAQQIWDWLYVKRVKTFQEMTNLNATLIEALSSMFIITAFEKSKHETSSDGTQKFLFKLRDGLLIETVLMKHNYGNSLCVTTQVGCNIGCSFCASGILKKQRDLSASEIVNQVIEVQRSIDATNERISHIVVMGIGEPFDNYKNLIKFLYVVNDPKGLAIGARHITVSTSGIVPMIYEFAKLPLQVNLAISLHSAIDETRSRIMKINNTYDLHQLREAIVFYVKQTNRRITFEYLMLKDVNDSVADGKALISFTKGILAYVNLIPYNTVDETNYQSTNKESVLKFYDQLKKAKVNVTVRREQGSDITAACGQLRAKNI